MSDCPVVSTPLGKVSGFALAKAKCPEAQQVYGYVGIPFAKPPVGDLRFRAPQNAEPWEGIRDGTKYPPAPMQSTDFTGKVEKYLVSYLIADEKAQYFDEDCLYLNVFTPKPKDDAKLPVLIWFHGGGYAIGGSVGCHGQSLCGLQDVVLVVPQYRLSAFGFISFGKESSCPGNMGLLDQNKAMEWTRDNILAFGGDPKNVTIFGLSAGGFSVSSHVLSPLSRGLFHRAISHSGVANFSLATKENNDVSNSHLLKELGIKDKDQEVILAKLRSLPAETIIKAQEQGVKNYDNPFQQLVDYTPVVDGNFLPMHPRDLLTKGDFAPVPYIIGCTNTEVCGIMATGFPEAFFSGDLTEKQSKTLMKNTLPFADEIQPNKLDEVLALIENEMMKTISPDDKYKLSKISADMNSDLIFVMPSIEQAIAHSDAGYPTYFYYMTQQLRIHHDEAYSKPIGKKVEFCEADHVDDTLFTFGLPFGNGRSARELKFTQDEKDLSKQWMSFICNFAKTGNPNGPQSAAKWPSYRSSDKRHLVFKVPFGEGKDLLGERYKFWQNLMENLPTKK